MSRNVIVIDDDLDDLDFMREMILEIDPRMNCMLFHHPEEAVELLTRKVVPFPHFIFIDINMPRMPGDQCLRSLRRLATLDATHIVLYSTTMSRQMAIALTDLGADFTFQKPNRMSEYMPILRQIFLQA